MTQSELVVAQTMERNVAPLAKQIYVASFAAGDPVTPEMAFKWASRFEELAMERFKVLL